MFISTFVQIVECVCILLITVSIINEFINSIHQIRINKRKVGSGELLQRPNVCPNCKSNKVYYEQHLGLQGEYVCHGCGWGIDSVTGEITDEGIREGV